MEIELESLKEKYKKLSESHQNQAEIIKRQTIMIAKLCKGISDLQYLTNKLLTGDE